MSGIQKFKEFLATGEGDLLGILKAQFGEDHYRTVLQYLSAQATESTRHKKAATLLFFGAGFGAGISATLVVAAIVRVFT